jgi:methylmalonyl-CoA mutase C-terminal domain/subunit
MPESYCPGGIDMEAQPGKKIRILIAKPGLDGHDRGAKVVVHALKNAGFEVIYTGLHQTVEQIVQAALQEDVSIIGLSILSGAHLPLTQSLLEELKKNHMEDVLVLVGGSIPKTDHKTLLDLGVAKIFPTSSNFDDIVDYINKMVGEKNA